MIVAVTLNPTTDFVAPVDSLVPGKIQRSENIFSYPAGKGTNTARALAALGAGVKATGFSGNTDLQKMNSFMKKYGIKSDFICVPGYNRICLLISGKKQETVINSESNLVISAKNRAALLKNLKKLSLKTHLFVFSGSLPLSVPASFYASCIRAVKDNSTIILDTSGRFLSEGIKAGPHILKVNIHELESAFGVNLKAVVGTSLPAAAAGTAPAEVARAVQTGFKYFICALSKKYRIKTIIVTLGSKGSVLFDNGVFHYIKPVKVKGAVSPVGCGDAYSAGLAYGIEKSLNMVDCCGLGSACAAANLKHKGACFFSKKEVLGLLPAGFHGKNLI